LFQLYWSRSLIEYQEWCCRFRCNCCNFSGGVTLNVRFTTNDMCAKKYTWREQAMIEWSGRVNSCCLLPQCEALRTCRSGFFDRNAMTMSMEN